jgi:molybdopterin converting factor small subunit
LLDVLCPGVSEDGDGISFACNHQIVPPDTVVNEGDLVVFLPPFGGG